MCSGSYREASLLSKLILNDRSLGRRVSGLGFGAVSVYYG